MSAFSHYRTKFEQTQEGTKAAEKESLKRNISRDFTRRAAYRLAIQVAKDGTETPLRLQTTRKKGYKSEFLIHPEDVAVPGNLVKDLSGFSWIIEEVVDIGEVMLKATLFQSNLVLKWMLEPGTLVETPVRVMAKTQLDALEKEKYAYLPSSVKVLILPLDNKTQTIKRQKRLMIDGNPYVVVKDEKFDYEGCLTLTLEETQQGEWDSDEVCDFNQPVPAGPAPKPITHMTGPTKIRRTLSGEYKLFVGETQVTSGIVWTVNNNNFTLSIKNGTAIVVAPSNTSLIGSEVVVSSQYFGVTRTITAKCISLI